MSTTQITYLCLCSCGGMTAFRILEDGVASKRRYWSAVFDYFIARPDCIDKSLPMAVVIY